MGCCNRTRRVYRAPNNTTPIGLRTPQNLSSTLSTPSKLTCNNANCKTSSYRIFQILTDPINSTRVKTYICQDCNNRFSVRENL